MNSQKELEKGHQGVEQLILRSTMQLNSHKLADQALLNDIQRQQEEVSRAFRKGSSGPSKYELARREAIRESTLKARQEIQEAFERMMAAGSKLTQSQQDEYAREARRKLRVEKRLADLENAVTGSLAKIASLEKAHLLAKRNKARAQSAQRARILKEQNLRRKDRE